MNWLEANAELVLALGTAAMALIWLIYLQLFYVIFCQHRRPWVLLQQSVGTDIHGQCILVNMSLTHVDLACVFLVGRVGGRRIRYQLRPQMTAEVGQSGHCGATPLESRKRGPLQPGEFTVIATFDERLRLARQTAGQGGKEGDVAGGGAPHEGMNDELEIRVVYFCRTHDGPLGARRRFTPRRRDDAVDIQPEIHHTHQLVSWWARRRALRWHKQSFN